MQAGRQAMKRTRRDRSGCRRARITRRAPRVACTHTRPAHVTRSRVRERRGEEDEEKGRKRARAGREKEGGRTRGKGEEGTVDRVPVSFFFCTSRRSTIHRRSEFMGHLARTVLIPHYVMSSPPASAPFDRLLDAAGKVRGSHRDRAFPSLAANRNPPAAEDRESLASGVSPAAESRVFSRRITRSVIVICARFTANFSRSKWRSSSPRAEFARRISPHCG